MATETITRVIDDLTGEERDDTATVRLVLNGKLFELDLCPESFGKLEAALAPFIGGLKPTKPSTAHRVSPSRGSGAKWPRQNKADREQGAEIRAWHATALEAGMKVPPMSGRGRLPRDVVDAYYAHQGKTMPTGAVEPAPAPSPAPPAAAFTRRPGKAAGKSTEAPAAPDLSRYTRAQRQEYFGRVRAWAKANGHPVKATGKLAEAVIAAYEAAVSA